MRKEYDLTKLKSRRNPYARDLKKQVTIRLGVDVISYFKGLAEETGIPYQQLINLYLRDCLVSKIGTVGASVTCSTSSGCPYPHVVNNRYQWSSTGTAVDGAAFTVFLAQL